MSMGWSAARKLRRAVDGLTRVLAVEVLTAARALDLRAPLEPAAGDRGGAGRAASEGGVPGPGPDRYLAPEIRDAVEYVRSGRAIAAAERSPGRCADRQQVVG